MRYFHLGAILTVTTGELISPKYLGDACELINYLTGRNLHVRELLKARKQCAEYLLLKFPQLEEVNEEYQPCVNREKWLEEKVVKYGMYFKINPFSNKQLPINYESEKEMKKMEKRFSRWVSKQEKDQFEELLLGKKHFNSAKIKKFYDNYQIRFLKCENILFDIDSDGCYELEYKEDNYRNIFKLMTKEGDRDVLTLYDVGYEVRLSKFFIQLFSACKSDVALFEYAANYYGYAGEEKGNWATLEK